jgi:hypothetical protein
MKIKWLLALLPVLISLCVFAQNRPGGQVMNPFSVVKLKGETESIDFRDVSSSSVTIVAKIKLEVHNDGEEPVIIFKQESPQITAAILTRSPSDPSTKALIVNHWGAAVDRSPKWSILRKSLDQSSPPRDMVRVLMPNESWRFDYEIHLVAPTDKGNRSYIPKGASFEALQQHSPIWLKLNWEVWPLNVEPWGDDRNKLKLGHSLRRRWKDVGVLWLDSIYSEPIKLDLKTVSHR